MSCFFISTNWRDRPVPNHLRALARRLVDRRHRTVLFYDGQPRDLEDHDANPAICVWPSPRPTGWRDALYLLGRIRSERPDVVVGSFGALTLFSLIGWLTRVPARVVWLHTLKRQMEIDARVSPTRLRIQLWRRWWVLRAATHLVANSGATARDVEESYGVSAARCQVFHNAIADPLERDPQLASVVRSSRKLVYAGRMTRSKGIDVLLRAVAGVRRTVPDLKVELIGGPCDDYRRLAEELGVDACCTFTGPLANPEVLRRMAGAAATVVPSRSEAFGLVNVESMAVGTPVVASAVGGITEIVRHGVDGFLVPPDDPPALAESLATLLTRPDLQRRLGASARERFLAQFEQQSMIERQAEWLERLAATASTTLMRDDAGETP